MSTFSRASEDGIARGERALLVLPDRSGEANARSTEARMDEAAGLAAAIGIEILDCEGARAVCGRERATWGERSIALVEEHAHAVPARARPRQDQSTAPS